MTAPVESVVAAKAIVPIDRAAMFSPHPAPPLRSPAPVRLRHPLVVTVHGMLASGRSFRPLARQLRAEGIEVQHFNYRSLGGSIVGHAERLRDHLREQIRRPEIDRLHLVTHSMGGIVARAALAMAGDDEVSIQMDRNHWRQKCGSLVMLAPPNGGSRLASIPLGPFQSMFPQLSELSELDDSFVNRLPQPAGWRVHVITAAHDRVVRPERTRLLMDHGHTTIATSHQGLVRHPETVDLAVKLLAMPQTELRRYSAAS